MDSNRCAIDDHLDVDSLLPPRKRLLAGLKRNNSPADSTPKGTIANSNAETDISMKSLSIDPHRSYEEIVEASRIAAEIAIAARANAEEKAAKAAKAIAAAKKALELVSTVTEKVEKYERRSTFKKHRQGHVNCNGTDEEMARKLHQAINSSPRISKNPSVADDTKNHMQKKLKSLVASSGKASVEYIADQPSTDTNMATIDLNVMKPDEKHRTGGDHQQKLGNGQREVTVVDSKGKHGEPLNGLVKKRGRPKQKKMSLSTLGSNEEGEVRSPPALGENNCVNSGSMSLERSPSLWTCES